MDLFELWATLGIDTGGFIDGIAGALRWALQALTDFAQDVIETGMGFDREMSAVQAVLGSVEGTEENMIRLREFALDQARDSIFTAEQTAEAYYYMGMAGWKTEQMLAGLPGIMALAAASGEDLGMVSDIVTDSLTAFGLSAEDATYFVDILAQAATNSNTDVKRMGETFKYIAPIAGSLGIEVEDVALAIGLLASQGIKGSMAGTALRNILTRLSTNAGATSKDLGALDILTEKLGVSFYDTAGNVRDFSDIIREARVSWKGLTEEQQVYYAKQIGSQRGMAAWLALMNAAEEDVDKLAAAFENAEGAAQGMADVKLDNLWGDIQMFNSSLDVLKVALFDDVKSPLRDVVQYATDALDRIKDRLDEDGLLGAIEQLGTEITDFGEKYQKEIQELGEAIVPILTTFVETITPAFVGLATTLGAAFAKGILTGFREYITGNWESILFGDTSYGIGLPGAYETKHPIGQPIDSTALVDSYMKQIQDAIDEANAKGETLVEIDGLVFRSDEPAEEILKALASVGADAGSEMSQLILDALNTTIPASLGDVGIQGGADMAKNVGEQMELYTPNITTDLAGALSGIGPNVGQNLANEIDEKLSQYNFRINVTAKVNGDNGSRWSPNTNNDVSNSAEFSVPQSNSASTGSTIVWEVDGKEFARNFLPYINTEQDRVGVSIVKGGVT